MAPSHQPCKIMPILFPKITGTAGKSSALHCRKGHWAYEQKRSVDISIPDEWEPETQIIIDAAAKFGVHLSHPRGTATNLFVSFHLIWIQLLAIQ